MFPSSPSLPHLFPLFPSSLLLFPVFFHLLSMTFALASPLTNLSLLKLLSFSHAFESSFISSLPLFASLNCILFYVFTQLFFFLSVRLCLLSVFCILSFTFLPISFTFLSTSSSTSTYSSLMSSPVKSEGSKNPSLPPSSTGGCEGRNFSSAKLPLKNFFLLSLSSTSVSFCGTELVIFFIFVCVCLFSLLCRVDA